MHWYNRMQYLPLVQYDVFDNTKIRLCQNTVGQHSYHEIV